MANIAPALINFERSKEKIYKESYLAFESLQNRRNQQRYSVLNFLANKHGSVPMKTLSRKLGNCCKLYVCRHLPNGELVPFGKARCKSKCCVHCARKLSSERKRQILEFFGSDKFDLSKYYAYHMVLTLKHDSETRTHDYSKDLITYFKRLRKKVRGKKLWFTQHVKGGFYSLEVSIKNSGPHIHLHVLMLTEVDLRTTNFLQEAKDYWLKITGDSTNIQLEKAYRLNEAREKVYFKKGDGVEDLKQIIAEACKYTVKVDSKSFNKYKRLEGATAESILTTRRRCFSFFGCLSKQGITSKDLSSLEDMNAAKGVIFSPTTGEVFTKSQAPIALTTRDNLIVNFVVPFNESERPAMYFYAKDSSRLYFTNSRKEAAMRLSQSLTGAVKCHVIKSYGYDVSPMSILLDLKGEKDNSREVMRE